MKLYPSALKNLPSSLRALVLSSFEEEVLETILSNFLEIHRKDRAVLRLPSSLLKTDFNRVLEILTSPPLFGEAPFLILEKITESSLEVLEHLLTLLPQKFFFILTASYIKASSSFRKSLEASPHIGFISLYTPTLSQIEIDIKALLSSYGQSIEPELLNYLASLYQDKYPLLKSELIPFCLYFESSSSLRLEDYFQFISKQVSTEAQCLEAFLLKKKSLAQFWVPSLSLISFLRLLNFHILRLIDIRPFFSSSREILKTFSSSLKEKALYEEALRIWSSHELLKVLETLKNLEIDIKTRKLDEPALFLKFLSQTYKE